MKKYLFLLLVSLMSGLLNLHAQVSIGGLSAPHPAAVLDLNKSVSLLGLKLSVVALDPDPTVFKLIASPTQQQKADATGMLVFSIGTTGSRNIYFWDGEQWNPLKGISPTIIGPAPPAGNNKKTTTQKEKDVEKDDNNPPTP